MRELMGNKTLAQINFTQLLNLHRISMLLFCYLQTQEKNLHPEISQDITYW